MNEEKCLFQKVGSCPIFYLKRIGVKKPPGKILFGVELFIGARQRVM